MQSGEEVWRVKQQLVQLLIKEGDALRLAAELLRTGNLQHPWILEVLRTADLNRAERLALVARLAELQPPV
jgi:hypothetical protein